MNTPCKCVVASIVLLLALPTRAQTTSAMPESPTVRAEQRTLDNAMLPGPIDFSAWQTEELPRRDLYQLIMGRQGPVPRSTWIESEKTLFRQVVRQGKFEILVAPFQIQGYGLDRSTRSLMMAQLSKRIGEAAPNPYVVQRALGEGARSDALGDIYRLSEGVKTFVMLFVGYEGGDTLIVTAKVMDRDANGTMGRTVRLKSWNDRKFSDERPPAIIFAELIPEIIEFAGIVQVKPAKQAPAAHRQAVAFPKTVADAMVLADRDPLYRAVVLQLFGTLSPEKPERARERLFEQALIALDEPSDGTSERARLVALLRARSLFYLHTRPAALAALGTPTTAEAQAFAHFLNGNLPDMERTVAMVTDPFLRLMLEIELQDMRVQYALPTSQRKPAFVESMLSKYPNWRSLVNRRISEGDSWNVQNNLEIKSILDRDFYLRGFDVETIGRGSHALGKAVEAIDIGLKVFEHINRVRQIDASLWKCPEHAGLCMRPAYLDLLESIAIANELKALNKVTNLQAIPEEASRLASRLSMSLEGQPDFLLMRSTVHALEAGRLAPAASPVALDASRADALAAAQLEQGQSLTSAAAVQRLGSLDRAGFVLGAAYAYDLPPRPYWSPPMVGMAPMPPGKTPQTPEMALKYSNLDVMAVVAMLSSKDPIQNQAGKAALAIRFIGHPSRAQFLATEPADADAELANLAAAIKSRPDLWANYSALSRRQVELKGDYAGAARTYASFPGFKDRAGYDAVALSNHSYVAGSLFFWRGYFQDAKKFYAISAGLNTGSAGSIASELRLDILDGRYQKAAELSLQRARRYNDAYAYRDHLSWLFAMGYSTDAWAGFSQLQAELENPQVWIAAHVGHRLDKRDWDSLRTWLLTEPVKSSAFRETKFALGYALMLNTIDRRPAVDLPDVLEEIEGTPRNRTYPGSNYVGMPYAVGQGTTVFPSSAFRASERGNFKQVITVRSPEFMFANAYVPLRSGDFTLSVKRFEEMAALYPIEGQHTFQFATYALPYFAWASARNGDSLRLEAFLVGLPEKERRFDFHLAMAFFTGLRGESDVAQAHLKSAFDTRPFTDSRPIFTEYQWAEACDWLFDATGNTAYRDMALKWARVNQRIQPMYAWAYAMEAKLAPLESDRVRALGFALYLDPLSERIAGFSEPVRKRASKLFDSNNPFKLTDGAKSKERIARTSQ